MDSMKPVHIMEVRKVDGRVDEFKNHYDVLDKILLHAEVKNRKIVVMSILGEFRKGKSFFLDYCLRFMYANYESVSGKSKPMIGFKDSWLGDGNEELKGFSWKHGRHADTQGILFWPDVFLYDSSEESEKIGIILMDTQGLFELGSTHDENARIFGLSTLISSILIVNVKEMIHEHQIEYLEMATTLTRHLSKLKKSTQWKPFQNLLFLIRDWSFSDIEGGFGYEGGKTYLKEFFTAHQNTKAKAIRETIKESFDNIKCFLLKSPGKVVKNEDFHGEWSKLKTEFVQLLKSLIESILKPENLVKKSILGKDMTGLQFYEFISVYCEAFRSAKVPDPQNILDMTIDNQMKSDVNKLLQDYQAMMRDGLDFNQDDFESYVQERHKNSKAAIILKYSELDKIDDAERILKFEKELKEKIEIIFKAWHQTKIEEHKRFMENKKLFDELNLKKEQHEKLLKDMNNQLIENTKQQQEQNEEIKRQKELNDRLSSQIESLTLSEAEKNRENKIINDQLMEKMNKNEQLLKEQQDLMKVMEKSYKKQEKEYEERIKALQSQPEKSDELAKVQKQLDDLKIAQEVSKQVNKHQSSRSTVSYQPFVDAFVSVVPKIVNAGIDVLKKKMDDDKNGKGGEADPSKIEEANPSKKEEEK